MKLHELVPGPGSHRKAKRVGRGHGSGKVKTSGRGQKGQGSRAGKGPKAYFEGGQNPWTMKIPHKRGFSRARFRVDAQVVNLDDIENHFGAGSVVTIEALGALGLVTDASGRTPVKLLGDGVVSKPVTVQVHRISGSAKASIEAVGGTVDLQVIRWVRSMNQAEKAAALGLAGDS